MPLVGVPTKSEVAASSPASIRVVRCQTAHLCPCRPCMLARALSHRKAPRRTDAGNTALARDVVSKRKSAATPTLKSEPSCVHLNILTSRAFTLLAEQLQDYAGRMHVPRESAQKRPRAIDQDGKAIEHIDCPAQ